MTSTKRNDGENVPSRDPERKLGDIKGYLNDDAMPINNWVNQQVFRVIKELKPGAMQTENDIISFGDEAGTLEIKTGGIVYETLEFVANWLAERGLAP